MDARQEQAVKLLNRLIETTLDSAHGYEEAAESAHEGRLRTLFAERSRRRRDLARRLQQEVRTFGGAPEDSASRLRRARDGLFALKDAVLGGQGESAVVEEVERGEDMITARFAEALAGEALPPNARQVVSHAYEAIRADHDEIARLKHALH
jgi:uncharacterized protein (TIGR02284 family)